MGDYLRIVEQLRLDNPERSRLFDIAEGMRVPLPEGFTPNAKGLLTPLRPAYIEVHQAVDKMLADLHGQGLAFCLPKKEAATTAFTLERPRGRLRKERRQEGV